MADKRDDSYEKYLRMAESAFLEPGPSSSKSLPAAPAKKLDVKENRNKKDRKGKFYSPFFNDTLFLEFSLDEPLEFVGPGKPTLIKFSAREVREESESDATGKFFLGSKEEDFIYRGGGYAYRVGGGDYADGFFVTFFKFQTKKNLSKKFRMLKILN